MILILNFGCYLLFVRWMILSVTIHRFYCNHMSLLFNLSISVTNEAKLLPIILLLFDGLITVITSIFVQEK